MGLESPHARSRSLHEQPLWWYNRAVGLVDKMLCCSYSGSQVVNEAAEVDYVEDSSITSMFEDRQDQTRPRGRDRASTGHPSSSHEPPLVAPRLANSKGLERLKQKFILTDDYASLQKSKKLHSSDDATVTTVSTSCNSTHSWNTLPSMYSSFDDSLLSHSDSLLLRRMRSSESGGHELSYRLSKLEKYHTDPQVAEQELIRKVQAESLAQLPYLSVTEGYEV